MKQLFFTELFAVWSLLGMLSTLKFKQVIGFWLVSDSGMFSTAREA